MAPTKAKRYLTATVSIAALMLLSRSAWAVELVWCPVFDEIADYEVRYCNAYPSATECNNGTVPIRDPDITSGQSDDVTQTKVRAAIDVAYKKGMRVIDIYFWVASSQIPSTLSSDDLIFMNLRAKTGQLWLDEIEAYNVSKVTNGDYWKVRLRVQAAGHMGELRLTNPTLYADLATIPTSIRECDGKQNEVLPDLANPAVRRYIGLFTKQVIQGAKTRLGSGRTKISEATLVFDSAGESSLWGDEGYNNAQCPENDAKTPFSSFSNARYPFGAAFRERANYFYQREIPLKSTYREFANAVNEVDAGIKPAIFLQTWAMDGRLRGTFDLYELLKGTGIKVIHHTTPPNNNVVYYSQENHRSMTAYTATVARMLGLEFDTEFSWAHYPGVGQPFHFDWTGSIPPDLNTMVPGNAQSFFRQAVGGFKFGATAAVYANWAMQSIDYPPLVSGSNTATDPDWYKMIGDNIRANVPSTAYLTTTNGLLASGNTSALPAAGKAIYISSIGRMDCEENSAAGATRGCLGAGILVDWFYEFGLSADLANKKVDVITDGMIRDGKVDWNSYGSVYLPWQTAQWTEATVRDILYRLPSTTKSKFHFQLYESDRGTGTFAQWLSASKPFMVQSVAPVIAPLAN